MQSTQVDIDTIMGFIRGQYSWMKLASVGMTIRFQDYGCVVEGSGKVVVSPTAVDIAQGFYHFNSDVEALQQWATVMLTASAIIDFAVVEQHPSSELLIEALWDASATQPLSKDAVEIIRQLADISTENRGAKTNM
jgi:hypothetical protein